MPAEPLVSIVVNCYNSEKFLRETINSVLEQTWANWEMIVWDNQSNDGTSAIAQSFADNRIKYFFASEHTSLGKARNLAMSKIAGEFFSFLDSDDLWEKSRLADCLNRFTSPDVGMVFSNCNLLYTDGREKNFIKMPAGEGDVLEEQLSNFTITLGSAMIRTSILGRLEYCFDNRFSMIEDFDFFIRIAQITKVAYCHRSLFKWRVHPGSLTWQKFALFEHEFVIFLKEFLEKNPSMAGKPCIERFKGKIAYHHFLNSWRTNGVPRRNVLKPYLLTDKRLLVVFLLSFFGRDFFEMVLKIFGRQA